MIDFPDNVPRESTTHLVTSHTTSKTIIGIIYVQGDECSQFSSILVMANALLPIRLLFAGQIILNARRKLPCYKNYYIPRRKIQHN